ncbi:hypothetical protein ACQP06_28565 [Nocardia sp. CA-136227]|uniref:hypothetical protein n=1 Tax=Nocardia sp. CA-136227 TaxID=3239979 RepID=UPI003D996693
MGFAASGCQIRCQFPTPNGYSRKCRAAGRGVAGSSPTPIGSAAATFDHSFRIHLAEKAIARPHTSGVVDLTRPDRLL